MPCMVQHAWRHRGQSTCICPAKHSLLHLQSRMTAVLLLSDMVEQCRRFVCMLWQTMLLESFQPPGNPYHATGMSHQQLMMFCCPLTAIHPGPVLRAAPKDIVLWKHMAPHHLGHGLLLAVGFMIFEFNQWCVEDRYTLASCAWLSHERSIMASALPY